MNKQFIQELFDVTGKVALITGATGGFGKAAATALAAAGAKVMITGRSTNKLEACAKDAGAAGYLVGDPTTHGDVARVVKGTVDALGPIDILITAAGVNKPGPITEQPDD